MKHTTNLAVKFIATTVVLAMLLPAATAYTLGGVLWVAAGLTLLAYLIGDLWVLPSYGPIPAVVADAVLVLLGLWALPAVLGTPPIPLTTIILAAVLLAVVEHFFHRYLQGKLALGEPVDLKDEGEGRPDQAGEGA